MSGVNGTKSLYSPNSFRFSLFFTLSFSVLESIFYVRRYDTEYLCRREDGGKICMMSEKARRLTKCILHHVQWCGKGVTVDKSAAINGSFPPAACILDLQSILLDCHIVMSHAIV